MSNHVVHFEIMGKDGGKLQESTMHPCSVGKSTLEKTVALGGKVVHPITEIPGMVTFAMFSDVEGNVIGIVKNVPRA